MEGRWGGLEWNGADVGGKRGRVRMERGGCWREEEEGWSGKMERGMNCKLNNVNKSFSDIGKFGIVY